jgi:hypothetical protein
MVYFDGSEAGWWIDDIKFAVGGDSPRQRRFQVYRKYRLYPKG